MKTSYFGNKVATADPNKEEALNKGTRGAYFPID